MDNNITVINGKQKMKRGYFDFSLLFLTIFLIGFGIIMLYSASSYNATKYYNDPMFFTRSQIKNALIGLVAIVVVTVINYSIYGKGPFGLPFIALVVCIGLMAFVYFRGDEHGGSQRWITFLGQSFQPSELAKVGLIVFVSYAVSAAPKKLSNWKGFLKILIYCSPLLIFVALENLSTAIVLAAIIFVTCFVASEKKFYYLIFLLIAIAAGAIFIFAVGYRTERIDIWLNVETHEKGGQILQGLYAIASAGLFGAGLGNSMQKLGFIPEAHNDMIFSIICEELGIFGAVAVLLLYVLVIWRIYVVAVNAKDLFGSMLCVGVMTNFSVQVIMNVAVVTNTMPSTGIALPFISYGGTSMLIFCVEIGMVLSVSARIERERVEA